VSGSELLGLVTHWWPDGQVVVEVGGELDANHAHQVFDAVARLDLHPGQRLDLQLENVTFLDSVGASVLVASEELTTRRGCAFRVSSTSLQCQAVLELVGLNRLLPTLDDPLEGQPGVLLVT
jgi:anti-sigma B factor antagonist